LYEYFIIYIILMSKVKEEDCTEIVETCIQSGVMLTVCHVLRYDPVIHKIKVVTLSFKS